MIDRSWDLVLTVLNQSWSFAQSMEARTKQPRTAHAILQTTNGKEELRKEKTTSWSTERTVHTHHALNAQQNARRTLLKRAAVEEKRATLKYKRKKRKTEKQKERANKQINFEFDSGPGDTVERHLNLPHHPPKRQTPILTWRKGRKIKTAADPLTWHSLNLPFTTQAKNTTERLQHTVLFQPSHFQSFHWF